MHEDELSLAALRLRRARARKAAAIRRRNTVLGGVLAVVLLVVAVLVLTGDDGDGSDEVASGTAPSTTAGNESGTTATTLPPLGSTSLVPPTDPPTPATEPVPAACDTSTWPLDARLRSLIFASLGGPAPADVQGLVDAGVGGIFVSSDAVPVLEGGALRGIVDAAPVRPLVSVDEEGGTVQRLEDLIGELPSARTMATEMTAEEVIELARTHGTAMRELGIDVDFAPVVDVTSSTEGVIGTRSFGGEAATVTERAGAFADGLREAGVTPTFKHFPGHGRADGDSHDGLVTTPPLEDLVADLQPYRDLLPTRPDAFVMVGHLAVPGLTDGLPATVSPAAIRLLRDDLGFGGVVVTDDLGAMQGIRDLYTTVEAAVAAIRAGVDMALVPAADTAGVVDALTAAVADGSLPEDQVIASADRVLQARQGEACA